MGTTVALALNITFAVTLVIGFLLGLWRGLKKSSFNFILSIIGILVAFFVTPIITNSVLSIEITVNGQQTSLNAFILEQLKSNPDITNLITSTPSIETFIEKLPYAISSAFVFILLTILFELGMYLIYRIIAWIFMRNKPGKKKHRLLGAGMGVIKAFIIGIMMFMPITALAGTVDSLSNNPDIYVQSETSASASEILTSSGTDTNPSDGNQNPDGDLGGAENIPTEEILQVVSSLKNNVFGYVGGVFGLDNLMFDYLSKVEVEGETVYIRQEVVNYYSAYQMANEIQTLANGQSEHKFSELNFDILENSVNGILAGGVYRAVVVDTITNIIINYQDYDFMQNETLQQFYPIFDDISIHLSALIQDKADSAIEYFSNDIKKAFTSFKTLAQSGAIDQIVASEKSEILDILTVLTNETNVEPFKQTLENVFAMNTIRDGIKSVSNMLLEKLVTGMDKVGADISTWVENDWKQLSQDLTDIIITATKLTEIDITSVMKDPLALLDTNSNINITSTLSNLGTVIDKLQTNKLFVTADGTPIVNKLLESNSLSLPEKTEIIKDANGEVVTIDSYTKLFDFIAPSLEKMKEINLYSLIKEPSVDAKQIVIFLADKIKTNENLLNEIILPLSQVKPTDTLINEQILSKMTSALFDLSLLENYDERKTDFEYISTLLVSLNKGSVGAENETYLSYMLSSSDPSTILLNLGEETKLVELLKPILYAKSTKGIRETLFNTFAEVLNNLLGTTTSGITFSLDKVTLKEGAVEDQADEICAVFESFIEIYRAFSENSSVQIKNLDKVALGKMLDRMKENAYRTELEEVKQEEGIFKFAFTNLINKVKETYQAELDAIGKYPLDKTEYIEKDFFTNLFTQLSSLQNA